MLLKQTTIKFYTKIGIAFLVVSSVVFYYVASKFKNELQSSNLNSKYFIKTTEIKYFKNLTQDLRSSLNDFSLNLIKKQRYQNGTSTNTDGIYRYGSGLEEVKLAVVSCGERLNQTLITLKSAIIFSKRRLHFVILADDSNRDHLKNKILEWPEKVLNRLSFEIHPISFPDGEEGDEWKHLFKLCACQRLFLPSLFEHIDSLLYVDTDVIFMHPVEELWDHFYKLNKSQIAALCPEHEDFSTGWYNRFARHPFYKPLGVNSGVMLMNLTRMRAFQWEKYLTPIMKEYKLNIVWGDQDIINIIFHFHSDKLYIFPCTWNFRPDHCMYSSVCKSARQSGVSVIHGNRGVFYNNKQPAFKVIYKAMLKYNLEQDSPHKFIEEVKTSLKSTANTNCGKHLSAIFSTSQVNSSLEINR